MTKMIDPKAAREHILANYPNDPLLRSMALTLVEGLPKVEVREVVHGRWLYDSATERYLCSVCNEKAFHTSIDKPVYDYDWEEILRYSHTDTIYEEHLTDFCPNCGATMYGGAGE